VNPDTLWDVDAVARYVLRRAMGRAGLVRGYLQVCRRKGCGHEEQAEDSELRHCPDCKMKPGRRPCRAICLPRLAARPHAARPRRRSLVVAQRMLRHADPRLTANVYARVDLAIFAPASRDCRRLDREVSISKVRVRCSRDEEAAATRCFPVAMTIAAGRGAEEARKFLDGRPAQPSASRTALPLKELLALKETSTVRCGTIPAATSMRTATRANGTGMPRRPSPPSGLALRSRGRRPRRRAVRRSRRRRTPPAGR